MAERIQPENNRTFTTGKGDWAGDLIWHGDEWFGRQGYISVQIEGSASPKTITLSYPAIKPVPGKNNIFITNVLYYEPSGSGFILDYGITDGVYTYEHHAEDFFEDIDWAGIGIAQILPADWDIENTTLYLTTGVIEDAPAELAFDGFTLQAEVAARADHLPLVGVH